MWFTHSWGVEELLPDACTLWHLLSAQAHDAAASSTLLVLLTPTAGSSKDTGLPETPVLSATPRTVALASPFPWLASARKTGAKDTNTACLQVQGNISFHFS